MTAAGGDPSLSTVAMRVFRGGLLPWLGALAVFGFVRWLAGPPAGSLGWVALYSVFVASIALPHVLVDAWLDRTQGIWSVA